MAGPFDFYNPNGMMRSYNTAPSEILARIQAGGQMLTNPYVTNVTGGGSTLAPVAPLFTPVPQQDPVTPAPVPVDPSVFASELDVFSGTDFSIDFPAIDIVAPNIRSIGGGTPNSVLEMMSKLANGEITPEEAKEQYPEAYELIYGAYEQQLEENQTDPETDVAVTPPPLLTEDAQEGTQEGTQEDTQEDTQEGTQEDTQEEEGSWTDSLPSLADLMGKIRDAAKDAIPSTDEEWGDLIRSILKAEGVNLPSGNIDDILAGGYGVRWDDFSQILKNIQEGVVFVPGLPGGVSPGSVDIGTIKNILSQPENVAKETWNKIVGAVKDPTTILSGVFGNTDEIPGWLEAAILAGDYGQNAIDWLEGITGSDTEDEALPPLTETPEDETPEETTVEETTDETPEEEDKLTFGGESTVDETPEEETIVDITKDDTTAPEETIEETIDTVDEDTPRGDQSLLTFGGEGVREEETIKLTDDEQEETIELIDDLNREDEEEEEELTSSSSGGGGGGGGSGGGSGDFTPFMSGISYQLPQIAAIIQSPNVDYNAQLNAMINRNVGLFEGMI
jgi:hypothetical protein